MKRKSENPISPRAARRVMVVEDEKNQRNMLTRTLSEMEFEVKAFGTGEEALRQLDDYAPTIAVLDLNLPGIGGLELASMIQERSPQTRLIVLTGYGDLEVARKAIRLDVVDFLLKPCPLDELETAVSRAFQKASEAAADPAGASPRPELEPADSAGDAKTIDDVERRMIAEALARHNGNRSAVARELGISVRTLYYRLSRYEAEDRITQKKSDIQSKKHT